MKTQAKKFFEIFESLDRAHGRFTAEGISSKGKLEGKVSLIRKPPSIELWSWHLEGKYGLGLTPITDQGTVRWGCIDVDDYTVDHALIEKEIVALKLPLIVCRSKSGGAHLFLFMKEMTDAEIVRSTLMNWAVILGYGSVEIFPKQTQLASENDFGNWLNMPYYGGDNTTRYAYKDGKALTPAQFFKAIQFVDADKLEQIELPTEATLEEAPPCLQALAHRGFPDGTRNSGLFNLAVYLRKRYGDGEWEAHLDEFNQRFMNPPLGHSEVKTTQQSVKRKSYQYRCKEPPINAVCSRQICLSRDFGVGGGADDAGVQFGQLIKINTEPPVYIWDVDGKRLEFGIEALMNQRVFQRLCIEKLNKWPSTIKPKSWITLVNNHLNKIEMLEAPFDASADGIVMSILEQFCTGRAKALDKDELLIGLPWTEQGRTYFHGPRFMRELENHKLRITPHKLWALFRRNGGQHHQFNLKGKGINIWSVPEFAEQIEEYDAVTVTEEPE